MLFNTNKLIIEAENFLNSKNLDHWVFSFGGCGTNYFRRILNIFRFEKHPNLVLMKAVHIYKPPKINNSNFLAIYIFGDPYLSFDSIFRRKIIGTINILAGKQIFKNEEQCNYKEVLNTNIDLLRFQIQFLNWYKSDTSYPILFINYLKLNKSILNEICQIIKSEFNINYNLDIINNFRDRLSNIENYDIEYLNSLKKIYNNFRNYINNLPPYWIKYPKLHMNLKDGDKKVINNISFQVVKSYKDSLILIPVNRLTVNNLVNMTLELEYHIMKNKESNLSDV